MLGSNGSKCHSSIVSTFIEYWEIFGVSFGFIHKGEHPFSIIIRFMLPHKSHNDIFQQLLLARHSGVCVQNRHSIPNELAATRNEAA